MKTKTSPLTILIGVLLLLGVLYLFERNSLAIQGYRVKDLKDEKNVVQQKKSFLNSQVAKKRSVKDLQTSVENKQMTEADFVHLEGKEALVKR